MSGKDIFEIEVLRWEENKGGLKENHTYFMISKRLFEHHRFANLTTAERYLYVVLLGRCADEYTKEIRCSREWVRMQIGSSKERVEKQLESLQRNQLVKWQKVAPNTIQNNTKQYSEPLAAQAEPIQISKPQKKPKPEKPSFDFDTIYQNYPRKLGKSAGIKKCIKEIKTPLDFELLSRAVDRYAKHIAESQTEARYVKHFSSFMTEWRDWLDFDVGSDRCGKKEIDLSCLMEEL